MSSHDFGQRVVLLLYSSCSSVVVVLKLNTNSNHSFQELGKANGILVEIPSFRNEIVTSDLGEFVSPHPSVILGSTFGDYTLVSSTPPLYSGLAVFSTCSKSLPRDRFPSLFGYP